MKTCLFIFETKKIEMHKFLLFLLLAAFVSCGDKQVPTSQAQESEENALSDQKGGEWIYLFDGSSLVLSKQN
jgi:hypothetical protein